MNENLLAVRQIVAEILLVPIERIDCHCALSQLPAWDSLTHLTLLMMLEEKTGHELPVELLRDSSSVSEVAELLSGSGYTLH